MGTATIWWICNIYIKEKVEYNQVHSYFAIIPLTSYIFFRNITPFLRSGVSMSLHELGKTTLETYLLQHHVWLTSNAKTLLTIVPNHPWINFMIASVMFYYLSRELYRLTMSLRLVSYLLLSVSSTNHMQGYAAAGEQIAHNVEYWRYCGDICCISTSCGDFA